MIKFPDPSFSYKCASWVTLSLASPAKVRLHGYLLVAIVTLGFLSISISMFFKFLQQSMTRIIMPRRTRSLICYWVGHTHTHTHSIYTRWHTYEEGRTVPKAPYSVCVCVCVPDLLPMLCHGCQVLETEKCQTLFLKKKTFGFHYLKFHRLKTRPTT